MSTDPPTADLQSIGADASVRRDRRLQRLEIVKAHVQLIAPTSGRDDLDRAYARAGCESPCQRLERRGRHRLPVLYAGTPAWAQRASTRRSSSRTEPGHVPSVGVGAVRTD